MFCNNIVLVFVQELISLIGNLFEENFKFWEMIHQMIVDEHLVFSLHHQHNDWLWNQSEQVLACWSVYVLCKSGTSSVQMSRELTWETCCSKSKLSYVQVNCFFLLLLFVFWECLKGIIYTNLLDLVVSYWVSLPHTETVHSLTKLRQEEQLCLRVSVYKCKWLFSKICLDFWP